MYITAQIVGILAVTLFVFSYQLKRRKHIILANVIANSLYVLQYIMLGAFEGATLDFLSAVSATAAHSKEKCFIGKHTKTVFLVTSVPMLIAGAFLYRNIFSLCAVGGALFQTIALWISDEKLIRRISFLAGPCWLVFNITSEAYGAAVGSFLSMVSIGLAIYRYDVHKK